MEVGHLIAVGQILVTLVVAVIGGLMRRTLTEMDRRFESIDARVQSLEQDAVMKEDWLRESGRNRIAQEKIIEQLAELRGQQRGTYEIGSAIAAALNRRDGGSVKGEKGEKGAEHG